MKTPKRTICSIPRVLPAAAGMLLMAIGAAQAADYPTTILADHPSAYYRFEEISGTTAVDSSSNGISATINENGELTSPELGVAGIDTNSFLFIGPGPGGNQADYGYVDIPTARTLRLWTALGRTAWRFPQSCGFSPTAFRPLGLSRSKWPNILTAGTFTFRSGRREWSDDQLFLFGHARRCLHLCRLSRRSNYVWELVSSCSDF